MQLQSGWQLCTKYRALEHIKKGVESKNEKSSSVKVTVPNGGGDVIIVEL